MVAGRSRVLVLGIDGLDYHFLRDYVERGGSLLGELARRGELRPLRSTVPPNSASAWVSMFTGVNPGKHGVFHFTKRGGGMVSAKDVRAPFLWELLSLAGMKSLVVNVPLTWPPSPMKGVLISGLPSSGGGNFTFPGWLSGTLAKVGYHPDLPRTPFALYSDDPEKLIETLKELEAVKIRAFMSLMGKKEWDLAILTLTMLDRFQHVFWRDGGGNDVALAVGAVESLVKEVIEGVDYDHILVVSDHGFYGASKQVLVFNWLYHRGFYEARSSKVIMQFARHLYESNRAFRTLAPKLLRVVKAIGIDIELSDRIERHDTRGPLSSVGVAGRYILLYGSGGWRPMAEDLLKIAEELERSAREVGESIISRVIDPRDIYWGEYLRESPDVIVELKSEYVPKPGIRLRDVLVTDLLAGGHHDEWGVILSSSRLGKDSPSVMDVAPTVMGMLGLASPKYMDGDNLAESEGGLDPRLIEIRPRRSSIHAVLRARFGI